MSVGHLYRKRRRLDVTGAPSTQPPGRPAYVAVPTARDLYCGASPRRRITRVSGDLSPEAEGDRDANLCTRDQFGRRRASAIASTRCRSLAPYGRGADTWHQNLCPGGKGGDDMADGAVVSLWRFAGVGRGGCGSQRIGRDRPRPTRRSFVRLGDTEPRSGERHESEAVAEDVRLRGRSGHVRGAGNALRRVRVILPDGVTVASDDACYAELLASALGTIGDSGEVGQCGPNAGGSDHAHPPLN